MCYNPGYTACFVLCISPSLAPWLSPGSEPSLTVMWSRLDTECARGSCVKVSVCKAPLLRSTVQPWEAAHGQTSASPSYLVVQTLPHIHPRHLGHHLPLTRSRTDDSRSVHFRIQVYD